MTAAEKRHSKKLINHLYEKYYANRKKKEDLPMTHHLKGPSRNDLMLKAKAKGIKNFRILNKQELTEILAEGVSQEQVNKIVTQAVAHWKSGWGTGKKRKVVDVKSS